MHRGRSTKHVLSDTCIRAQCREDAAHGTPKRQEVMKEQRRIDQQHERKKGGRDQERITTGVILLGRGRCHPIGIFLVVPIGSNTAVDESTARDRY